MATMARAYDAIQPVASDCSSDPADRQVRPVDGPDVVEAKEAALEHVVAVRVLAG